MYDYLTLEMVLKYLTVALKIFGSFVLLIWVISSIAFIIAYIKFSKEYKEEGIT